MKTALITGITGQDGSYLAELLLSKGYIVHGIVRRASLFNTARIDHLYSDKHDKDTRLFLHYGDMSDGTGLRRILEKTKPDEVYNLASQSHVRISFDQPEYTADVVGMGALRLFESVRDYIDSSGKQVKVYQASSSEMFGAAAPPQDENTLFRPQSPYGIAKVAAFHFANLYREAYKIFICNGILFNHESERRGENFVTRKITRAATRIKLGLQKKLYLGNLDSRRDWGHSRDYVEAMWLMMQHDKPDDYVIATGESHSIREFLTCTFDLLGLNWTEHVEIDQQYFRPAEVNYLLGNATKAYKMLGWQPKISFRQLAETMVKYDMELAKKELILNKESSNDTQVS